MQRPTQDFPSPPYLVGISDGSRDAVWRKVRDRSGVHDLTFHDTKHEACTRLASLIDVLALSHAVGTKDLTLLRDTYYANDIARTVARLPSRISNGC
jgi:integrase